MQLYFNFVRDEKKSSFDLGNIVLNQNLVSLAEDKVKLRRGKDQSSVLFWEQVIYDCRI